jgi:hypothetical protein
MSEQDRAAAAAVAALAAAAVAALPDPADEDAFWAGGPPGDDDPAPWECDPPDRDVLAEDPDAAFWAAEAAPRPAGWTGEGEAWPAGFLHRDRDDVPSGTGFASGGHLDLLEGGPLLALAAANVTDGGHDGLGESELIGVLTAWRKVASWAAAGQAAAVITLARRRQAQAAERDNPHLAEHVGDEVAAALTLTAHAARTLLSDAAGLARLPAVHAALSTGQIDPAKAAVFTTELSALPADQIATEIADAVLPDAAGLTTSQIRNRLRRRILAADPDALHRRSSEARRDADVHLWAEPSGNACLAGRELPEAGALAADRRLTALARWLSRHGCDGTLGQLRAAVFLAQLTGRPIQTLLPAPAPATQGPADPDAPPAPGRADDPGGPPAPAVSGVIHLTLPLTAFAGLADTAGDVAGYGPAPAATCRDLAALLAAAAGTRWQLTLTGPGGQPLATRLMPPGTRPPPPGPAALRWARAAATTLDPLTAGPCDHTRAEDRYQPTPRLRNLIHTRHRTCAFPGCRRPATTCDLDHTRPWHLGGLTCECNLAPLCRHHHRAKQAWHLDHTTPGTLTWTTPSSRTYTTTPEPLPV